MVKLLEPGWKERVDRLSELTGIDVHSYAAYIQALEERRRNFKQLDAAATDHDALTDS